MLDLDSIREVGATIKKSKLRTFLTGFSIAWGIFMLIFLLGAGNGLKNGIESNFSGRAKNTISAMPGVTSKPYKGLPIDRTIKFDDKDLNIIKTLPEIEYISGQISRRKTISNNNEYGSWNLLGVHPDAAYIDNVDIPTTSGRFINDFDIIDKRKVIVINSEIKDILFKGQNPIGKNIIVDGISFLVIGVYKDETGRTNIPAYIPFTTAESLYSQDRSIDKIYFTVKGLNSLAENESFIKKFKELIGGLHRFDPEDDSAIYFWNTAEQSVQTANIFSAITLFIWVVGILSLIAGIVGVGNIMLITVKERTREFGIRKAIGASPISILKLVILESVFITSLFGYIGMLFGIIVTEVANKVIDNMVKNAEDSARVIFLNPTVDFGVVFQATLVLIIAGVTAGCIPALRAVKIKPVEAMRAE